jgi:Tfp pilus assembly protein PilX
MINIIVMNNKRVKHDERGIVSIIVVLIFIIVIGLIVIGFGQVSRNQTGQTIDNQLSTSSYYAAQSGINNLLQSLLDPNFSITTNSDCSTGVNQFLSFNSNSSSSKITCAKWSNTVSSLEYADVATDKSTIAYIPKSSLNLNLALGGDTSYTLDIKWNGKGVNAIKSGCNSNNHFTSVSLHASNCLTPDLRIDISPDFAICNTRSCLNYNSKTIFALSEYNRNPSLITYSAALGNPNIVKGYRGSSNSDMELKITCKVTLPCSYIKLRSIYGDSSVSISGTSSSSNPLSFKGDQAQIDVTAVTNGVARRVLAVADLSSSSPNNVSEFAIMSTKSICKVSQISNNTGDIAGLVNNVSAADSNFYGDITACDTKQSP